MSPAGVIAVLGGVAGLMTILTTAYVVMKSTLARTTVELWKQEADALRVRLETVELSDKGCKERLAAVEAANKVLSDHVTGATALASLAAHVEKEFADVKALLGGKRHTEAS